MNRSIIILLGALTLGAALFAGSFAASRRVCQICVAPPPGSLNWMKSEFHLDDAQMARIQKLHADYLRQCDAMCRMVAEKKQALAAALNQSTNVSANAENKLSELAACRAHCAARMIQYFNDVSRVMPPDAGRRYLAEMKQLTLGLQSEGNPAAPAAPKTNGAD